MTSKEDKRLIEDLLEFVCVDNSDKLEFLRDTGLINAKECTYYVYETPSGDYIGNDADNDFYDLKDELLDYISVNDFLEEFLDDYYDQEYIEELKNKGLSDKEIAQKLLEPENDK